jgi:hypothetical protein
VEFVGTEGGMGGVRWSVGCATDGGGWCRVGGGSAALSHVEAGEGAR